jgi:hypothetical protein
MARFGRSFPTKSKLGKKVGRYTTAIRTFPWPIRVALQSRALRLQKARVTHAIVRRPTKVVAQPPAVFPHRIRIQAAIRVRPRPVHSTLRRKIGRYTTAFRLRPALRALQAIGGRLLRARQIRSRLRQPGKGLPPPAAVFPHHIRVQAPVRVRPRPVYSRLRPKVGRYTTTFRLWPAHRALQATAARLLRSRQIRSRLRPAGKGVPPVVVFPAPIRRLFAQFQPLRWRRVRSGIRPVIGRRTTAVRIWPIRVYRQAQARSLLRARVTHVILRRPGRGVPIIVVFPKPIRRVLQALAAATRRSRYPVQAKLRRPLGRHTTASRTFPLPIRRTLWSVKRQELRLRLRTHPLYTRAHGGIGAAPTGLRHRVSDIESAHIATTSRSSRLQSDIESPGKLTTTRANPKVADTESSGKSSTTVEGS